MRFWSICAFVWAIGAICEGAAQTKPNIIFILTDDHRYDALGFLGNPYAHTPAINSLAKSGTYFRNAFASTPICAASRATILSGMYERTHKYTFQTANLREEYMRTAYPKVLREAGYHTGFFGKFGVGYASLSALFDVHENYDRATNFRDKRGYFYKTLGRDTVHLTRYTGQKALDFIAQAPKNKPFCLSLSFSAPHAHDNAPEQYFYDEQTADWLKDVVIPPAYMADDAYFNALPEGVRRGFSHQRWAWRFDQPDKYQRMMKAYYRMIAGIDIEIGKIRKTLQQQGLDKNTIIILLGDNGYFLGERQLADKWLMYDLSIRVPFLIYDPRRPKAKVIEEQVLNVDLASTIADIAGLKPPAAWQGKSLYPLVAGQTKRLQRDTILIEHLWEFADIPPSEGVRTLEWKYFRYVNDKTWEELYYLKKDPDETNNLAKNPQYTTVLANLRQSTERLIEQYRDPYSDVPAGLAVTYENGSPRYSWQLPKEAVAQKGYQILVASSKTKLDHNLGDVWDSKPVVKNQNTHIAYGGSPLRSGQTYYWKVRIWDADNRLSDYSYLQTFQAKREE